MLRNLPTDFLRSLVTVSDMESFTKAGDVMGRSQSAVSLQMKKLEQLVGQPLFLRNGHNFRLTHQGETLVRYAREILALNDRAFYDLNPQTDYGTLRLGIPSEFTTGVLSKVLGNFSRSYPNITLQVKCDLSKNLRAGFLNEQYDLVFTLNEDSKTNAPLVGENHFVRSDELVWVSAQPITFSAEHTVQLVVADEGCLYRKNAISWLEDNHIPWRIVYNINEISGMMVALEQNMGITVLAKSVVPEHLVMNTSHQKLAPLAKIGMALTIHKNCTIDAAKPLLQYIEQALL